MQAIKLVYQDELPHYEGSTPGISQFDPNFVAWQMDAIRLVRTWNYQKSKLELLLSGALGSAKSIVMAHIVVTHCLNNERARACIARRTMPDLKSTLFQKILEHISNDPDMVEGIDYRCVATKGYIRFANGSEIISRSWADRKGGKGARSLDLSLLAIEELTENDDQDKKAIMELIQRVGRLRHVAESLVIAATNPDEPDHWAYKYFISEPSPDRRVIYSITTDNCFLEPWYHETLLRDLDPRMALRMIHGKWISIAREGVYYQYSKELHEPEHRFEVDPNLPIVMSWDFNIGAGKPISATFSQFKNGTKHFFDEVVIEGARTQNVLEEAWARGIFKTPTIYYIRGDASGTHRDTRNNINDYQVIDEWLQSRVREDGSRVMHRRQVPVANPPVRSRHNVANSWLLNDLGQTRIQVYPKCKVLREGMKLVKLRPGAQYIEDDTKYFQHVTTAATYDIHYEHVNRTRGTTTSRPRG